MPRDGFTNPRRPSAVDDLERAVVLGQAFVEPQRRIGEYTSQKQMRVFVEDNGERLVARLEAQGDVIDVLTADEHAGDRKCPSVHARHEWAVSLVVRKHDDDNRRAAVAEGGRNQLRDDVAELLELEGYVPQLSDRDVSNDLKVFRA